MSKLADLRQRYTQGGFDVAEAAADPLQQFTHWLNQALEAEVTEPNAMTLATANADGVPSARTVLLKGTDQGGFSFFTNYRSHKGRDLEENPRASLVLLWRELERQVIIRGTVSRCTEEESRSYFHSRPRESQIGAWVSEEQSSEIPDRAWLEDRERDLLERWPGDTEVPLPEFWGGYRLDPHYLEFWQGRPSRLHDRIVYLPDDSGQGWRRARLSP